MQKMMRPAEIFKITSNSIEFKNSLIALNGEFPFETEDMMELGKEYFARYPDSFSDRNLKEVHEGYAITRSCILEKMLCGIDASVKGKMRLLFEDVSKTDELLKALQESIGIAKIKEYIEIIDNNLNTIMSNVDALPKGIIKERFIGGITKFFNMMYILKSKISQIST